MRSVLFPLRDALSIGQALQVEIVWFLFDFQRELKQVNALLQVARLTVDCDQQDLTETKMENVFKS